mmetsp:Transcript_3475/g.4613  ORF Transcript_3475/g.4613 Transcript_3475/m.4613 type:complete len:112 (-) Transcript_3475:1558-1893(-)
MTVFLVFSLLFYGVMQSVKLITYDETDVMVSSRDSYFSADHVHTDGLWFAFGLTEYDSNPMPIEDPSIGVVRPGYKQWGTDATSFVDLKTRNCTEAELHINGQSDPNSKFY